ncbi:hypothetical protein [Oceanicaulis alexandrii]|uniref:hypothetical protein n=1 Tax=Oceanicaulis alexandrii TaxID=153233 RepID=UPI0003B62FDE|nr:hypothetical protein [Oceanicaulis alexandrii]
MHHPKTHPLKASVIEVTDASEYVSAIKTVNRGEGSAIDVVESFALTASAPSFTRSAKLYSSTGASIDAKGYSAVEVVGEGVILTLSLTIEGTGFTQVFQGQLTGLEGGQIHDALLVQGGALNVPSGESFTVTGQLEAVSKGAVGVGGVLNATNPLTISNGGLVITQTGQQPCAITQTIVADQGTIVGLNPNSTLTVDGLSLSDDCVIEAVDASSTILSATPVLLAPDNPSKVARMVAVNASKVTLKPGGVYQGCGVTPGGGGQAVRVDTLSNEGGVVELGGHGALKCTQFDQTDGLISMTLTDCQSEGPTLVVDEGGAVTGGAFIIKGPGARADPPTQTVKLPLVVTVSGNSLPDQLNAIAQLKAFPASVTASLSVEAENALVLTLTPT